MSLFTRWRYRLRCSPLLRTRCWHASRLLQDYLDRSCPPGDLELVESHLADCRPCGLEAEVYRRIRNSLASGNAVPPEAVRRLEQFADGLADTPPDEHDGRRP